MIGDDYSKVGRTPIVKKPDVQRMKDYIAPGFDVYVIGQKRMYVLDDSDPAKLLGVRRVSDMTSLIELANSDENGACTRENLTKNCMLVDDYEARTALMAIGLETKRNIAKKFPQFNEFVLDKICEKYGISKTNATTEETGKFLIGISNSGKAAYFDVAGRKFVIYAYSLDNPFDFREICENGEEMPVLGENAGKILKTLGYTKEAIAKEIPADSNVGIESICEKLCVRG